jgi:diacylglycerol kinase family enzyme
VRISLIHHPGAGDDDQPDAEALSRLLRRHGHTVRYQSADDDTWAAVLDEPADLIVVAGGDGTVGRVAKKLIGRKLTLAPLPLGTASNISKTLGLADRTLDEIVAGWENGERIRFDAGIANGPWGSRYFIEAFGIGLFACTIPVADRNRTLKNLDDADAKVAYALGMLRDRLHECPHHRLEMTIDGRPRAGDYVLFEAMNTAFVGPNLHLAPEMHPADGMLDLVLVTAEERHSLEEPLENWRDGEHHVADLPRVRASTIELEWTGFEVHIDDESWPRKDADTGSASGRIELRVERDAVEFLAPRRQVEAA